MKVLDTFILAVQLLTRIPIKKQVAVKDDTLVNGVVFWPLIGLITGAIQLGVYYLLSFIMARPAAIVLAVLTQIVINGGFHLDGLCDTADGIYSARTRERMLEIMKDSRIGTNGVIAALFDILLKITLLGQLAHPMIPMLLMPVAGKLVQIMKDSRIGTNGVIAALFDILLKITLLGQLAHPMIPMLLMPVAGKLVQGILIYKASYARKEGLGNAYIGKISLPVFVISTAVGTVIMAGILVFSGSLWLIFVPFICLLFAFGFRRYIEAKLGGLTGDILGAGSELTEIIFLILMSIADTFLLI